MAAHYHKHLAQTQDTNYQTGGTRAPEAGLDRAPTQLPPPETELAATKYLTLHGTETADC